MKSTEDLPDIASLIEVTNPGDASNWLALNGFYKWEQPTPPDQDRYDSARREIRYKVQGYLVHQPDIELLFEWAIKQDCRGRWTPEVGGLYHAFLGELFWSPAYEYFSDPYERSVGWQGGTTGSRVPKPVMPLSESYCQESSGFDCSIDENIDIKVPCQLIADAMELTWSGVEGHYYDQTAKLTVFDPSVSQRGPSVLLVNREAFLAFLHENNYAVLWTVLGEKQLIGGDIDHRNWLGRTEMSGAYRIHASTLHGRIQHRFRSPLDKP
jgi:hypothetical protein